MSHELIAGRYRLERAVGQGGMGTVWLGLDEVLQRRVALKHIGVLPGESADDRRRALREARTAAALNHRHAVSVFDVVDNGDATWIVMEVPRVAHPVRGDGGRTAAGRAGGDGTQVAQALAAAHAVGVIHRDVKPGNILVGDDDETKISDFGIAHPMRDERLTQTGLVSGTPTYFSPELARGADPGPPSDVWALGATLYAARRGGPQPHQPRSTRWRPCRPSRTSRSRSRSEPGSSASRWRGCWTATPTRVGPWRRPRPGSRPSRAGSGHPPSSAAPTRRSRTQAAPPPTTPTAPTPRQPSSAPVAPPETPGPPPRRSRAFPAALALAAVLLVVIGTLVVLSLGDDDPPAAGSGGGLRSEKADQEASPDREESSPAGEESSTRRNPRNPRRARRPSRARAEETQPTEGSPGSPTRWARWTRPSTRCPTTSTRAGRCWHRRCVKHVGRDAYDGFWATIADVDAQDVQEAADGTVTARIAHGRRRQHLGREPGLHPGPGRGRRLPHRHRPLTPRPTGPDH